MPSVLRLVTMVVTRKRPSVPPTATPTLKIRRSSNVPGNVTATAEALLKEAGIVHGTKTKAGWCLKEGLTHILSADEGKMVPLIQKHGAPKMYDWLKAEAKACRHEEIMVGDEGVSSLMPPDKAHFCFQSLCRIIGGQQLAGAAAFAMYRRLRNLTDDKLNPDIILSLANQGVEEYLRKPVGLSKAKANCIVALAQAFHDGDLSEDFLYSASVPETREALLKIKGIGPWSCDMFLMFVMEHADVFPIGDLGVRNGMTKFFRLKGTGKSGYLCQKKDLKKMEKAMAPFEPYRSLACYYMWRVADTKDVVNATSSTTTTMSPKQTDDDAAIATPKKRKVTTKITRTVTP
eukprot:scaffold19324_cov152-Cylindrotheca_fusiformis.AAC.15